MRSSSPSQIRSASAISGISRGSRREIRTQPQFRELCSPPICPFSHNSTDKPRSDSSSAVEAPMIPPPITTTSTDLGSCLSVGYVRSSGPGNSASDEIHQMTEPCTTTRQLQCAIATRAEAFRLPSRPCLRDAVPAAGQRVPPCPGQHHLPARMSAGRDPGSSVRAGSRRHAGRARCTGLPSPAVQ